jgi:hypothetical protein
VISGGGGGGGGGGHQVIRELPYLDLRKFCYIVVD